MDLQLLIVTGDPTLLDHVQASLGTRGAFLHLRQDSASAIGFVSRRHLDGLVVDCDDVPGGVQALPDLRTSPANKQTPILAVVNGLTGAQEALNLGADFALSKPIQQTRLRSVIDMAIPRMEREHRRYSDTTLICRCSFEIRWGNPSLLGCRTLVRAGWPSS